MDLIVEKALKFIFGRTDNTWFTSFVAIIKRASVGIFAKSPMDAGNFI